MSIRPKENFSIEYRCKNILDNTNQWEEDPRPLAAPCWGGDCLSNLSILPSPGVHLSKSVHMDTRGGKVRPGPGLSLQGGEDTQRYWLQVPSDTDCTMVLVNYWKIYIKYSTFKYVLEVFHATSFTFSGNSGGPNVRRLIHPITVAECNDKL